MKPGKRIRNLREGRDLRAAHSLADAIALVKEAATAKFDESVEAALRLGIDPRKSEQAVRGAVMLPAGSGRKVRVAVAAEGEQAAAAMEAGADKAGLTDLADEIKSGKIDFDVLIAAPAAMRALAALGRVLGPRGLMPNPKSGTVAADVAAAVKRAKSGQVGYRADRAGVVHLAVGKASFAADDLRRNVAALIDSVKKGKPAASKGVYLRRLSLSSTMGIGVRVDLTPYR